MMQYLGNDANTYAYWNILLKQRSLNRWGWRQNSPVAADEAARVSNRTPGCYSSKRLGHYVRWVTAARSGFSKPRL